MKAHHSSLAKYWANIAAVHHATGYHHLGALYESYAAKHAATAGEYA